MAGGAAPEAMGCGGSSWLPCSLLMGTKARIRLLQCKGTQRCGYQQLRTPPWDQATHRALGASSPHCSEHGGCRLEAHTASIPTAFGDEVHVRMQHGGPVESYRPASREATSRQGTGAGMLQGHELAPAPSLRPHSTELMVWGGSGAGPAAGRAASSPQPSREERTRAECSLSALERYHGMRAE